MFVHWTLSLISLIFPVHSLICPIYNLYNNETIPIDVCLETSPSCTSWIRETSTHRRCLGIYTFDHNGKGKDHRIRIRQLAMVDDFEMRYVNRTQCFLDIDRTGQNLLCRCNADNCTLQWKTGDNFHDDLVERRTHFDRSLMEPREDNQWFSPIIIISIAVVLMVLLFTLIMILSHYHHGKHREKHDGSYFTHLSSTSTTITNTDIEEFLSSNSTYESMISHGKTNKIYRVSMAHQSGTDEERKVVAVKVYHDQHYRYMFDNEFQILRMVHHSAIVSFIGAGWHDQCPYLIFEYYPLGSLDQYLKRGKLSLNTCYAFLRSLLQAIDYLHYEDLSPTDYFTSHRIRKPIIVHRDIKSSNLLVKNTSELSLCLTDFGLAKILPPVLTVNDFIQIGTYRYMAPELLELAISHTSEALCKVDIYASALVMWEIVGQCDEYPCSVEHQLPYVDYVKVEETNENRILDTLHRVVVNERKRPILHRTSTIHPKLEEIFSLIEDCWKHEPESRINARPALSRLERLFKSSQ